MAVETEFDRPDPIELPCPLCGKPKLTNYYWLAFTNRWVHAPPCHDQCVDDYIRRRESKTPEKRFEIPEKFNVPFEPLHFRNDRAFCKAIDFGPDCPKHVFAIMGMPGKGKSRLCWHVMDGFFREHKARTGFIRSPEVFSWPDMVTDNDPHQLQQMKKAPYVYVADIGSTDAIGRIRVLLQATIRHRIQRNMWTWLDIDNLKYDEDVGRILKNEAFAIFLDE